MPKPLFSRMLGPRRRSDVSALAPASTTTRSGAGRLTTVASTVAAHTVGVAKEVGMGPVVKDRGARPKLIDARMELSSCKQRRRRSHADLAGRAGGVADGLRSLKHLALGLVGDHGQVGVVLGGVVVPFVGVDAAQGEPRRVQNSLGQIDGLVRFDDAGAALANVDLGADVQGIGPSKGLAQQIDLVGMVDADGEPDAFGQRSQPTQLGRADDLVGNEYVVDPAVGEHLGLPGLGAADALGAGGNLELRNREHAGAS